MANIIEGGTNIYLGGGEMNKQQFLVEINARLGKLKEQERLDIQRDFEEYFENGIREGKKEEEIVAAFGKIDELVDALLEAYTEEDFVETASYSLEKQVEKLFSKIEIKSNLSDCTIEPSPDNEPHILYNDEGLKQYSKMSIEGDTLKISIKNKKNNFFIFGLNFLSSGKGRVRIQLPVHVYEEIRVKNNVGNISLLDMQCKELHIRNEVGRIQLKNSISTSLNVKNEAGSILLENTYTMTGKVQTEFGKQHILNSKAEQWRLKSEAGNVLVENTSGKVKLYSEVGSVTIKQKQITEEYDLKSEVGAITVITDEPIVNAVIRVKKEIGSAKIYNEKMTHYSNGTGEIPIKINSEIGKVMIGVKV